MIWNGTDVTDRPAPGIGRFVEGTFSVLNWMTEDGGPGTVLNRLEDGTPEITGVRQAPFACTIPDSVIDGDRPGRASAPASASWRSMRRFMVRAWENFSSARFHFPWR